MVVVTDVRTRKVHYGNCQGTTGSRPFHGHRARVASRAPLECDKISSRRALGLRRACGCVAAANDGCAYWARPSEPTPPSATLSDRLGCLRVTYLALNNGAQ